ncbi:MAG: hypothetical protein ACTHJ3_00705 [Pararhizobium sp.]
MTKLLSIFRKPSVDAAIKGITKALDHLETVVAHEAAQIGKFEAKIAQHTDAMASSAVRRDRAASIAKRFTDLVA